MRDIRDFYGAGCGDPRTGVDKGGHARVRFYTPRTMARVTVEDCLARIENRFALTVLASRRARALCESRGTPMVECSNKQAVTALREVAQARVRYVENVAEVMADYISDQRASLRGDDTDSTFLETVPFNAGEVGGEEDTEDGVEELTSDLQSLGTAGADKPEDDDSPSATQAAEGPGDAGTEMREVGGETEPSAGPEDLGVGAAVDDLGGEDEEEGDAAEEEGDAAEEETGGGSDDTSDPA